jgi:hypothetical protein
MNPKKQFVASKFQDYMVPFDRLRHYYALCVIEVDDPTAQITLPKSLAPEESLYFDRILFVVIGNFPELLA